MKLNNTKILIRGQEHQTAILANLEELGYDITDTDKHLRHSIYIYSKKHLTRNTPRDSLSYGNFHEHEFTEIFFHDGEFTTTPPPLNAYSLPIGAEVQLKPWNTLVRDYEYSHMFYGQNDSLLKIGALHMRGEHVEYLQKVRTATVERTTGTKGVHIKGISGKLSIELIEKVLKW